MPEAVEFKYKCTICNKVYTDKDKLKAERKARHCEQHHDIVYVPLQRGWVRAIISYIYTGERSLISEKLLKTLKEYR